MCYTAGKSSPKEKPDVGSIGQGLRTHESSQLDVYPLHQEYSKSQSESSFAAAGCAGLSPAHISPLRCDPHFKSSPHFHSAAATFYAGGSLVQVKTGKIAGLRRAGGGLRGRVRGFSQASRRRLLRKIATIDQAAIPVFVTLTYPAEWSQDSGEWKRDFDRWCKRLRRRFPLAGLVWKLEAQRRGAPHFHCLVWGAECGQLRAWAAAAWFESVGSGDVRHLRAGTRVEMIRSWRGVRSYAAKYLGKASLAGAWEAPGRIWGVRYGENIPWAEAVKLACSDWQAARLMRAMRRYAQLRGLKSHTGLTVLVNDGSFWLARAGELLGAPF